MAGRSEVVLSLYSTLMSPPTWSNVSGSGDQHKKGLKQLKWVQQRATKYGAWQETVLFPVRTSCFNLHKIFFAMRTFKQWDRLPERLYSLHPWLFSRPSWIKLSATRSDLRSRPTVNRNQNWRPPAVPSE